MIARGSVTPPVRARRAVPAQRAASAWSLAIVGLAGYLLTAHSYRLPTSVPFVILGLVGVAVGGQQLRFPRPLQLLLGMVAWSLLGALFSPYQSTALSGWIEFTKIVIIFCLLVWSIDSMRRFQLVLTIFLLCFFAFPVRGTMFNYFLYDSGFSTATGGVRAAWTGLFGNPNDMAAYGLLAVGPTLAGAYLFSSRWSRLACWAGAGMLVLLILLTQSRGAFIGLAVTSVIFAIRLRVYRKPRFILMGLLLAVSSTALLPKAAIERFAALKFLSSTETISLADAEGSADQRFEIAKVALSIWTRNPVLGIGIGAYPAAHSDYSVSGGFRPTSFGPRDAHNTYLRLAAETGLPGLLLFLTVIFVIVKQSVLLRRLATSRQALAIEAMLLVLPGFLLASVFGSYGEVPPLYLHLGLMLGLTGLVRVTGRRQSSPTRK